MSATYRTLFVTSITFNILLIISFYAFGDVTSYYFGNKAMERDITPIIQIVASAPPPEPTISLSERGRGGEGCTMCGVAPRLCDKIGEDKLNQAVSYGGSNDRLRRVLAKIKSGEPFTMGVIGGSVSLAHGVRWGEGEEFPREPWYRPQSMHRIIFEHLHYLSPLSAEDDIPFDPTTLSGPVGSTSGEGVVFGESGKKSSRNALVNGAQGGTGSGYFAYCWGEHVPQDTDIFIVELSINDELLTKNIESYELLVRSLLELPHKPAVLYIDIFALMFDSMGLGGEMHKGINQYYDIPSISLRNPFLPQVLDSFKMVEKFFFRQDGKKGEMEGMDLRHISPYAHQMTGDLVNAYIDMQLCEMERRSPTKTGGKDPKAPKETRPIEAQYPVAEIPKMLINKQYKLDQVVPQLKPQCMTMKSKTKKLEPIKQKGWRTWSYGEKHYWISTEPHSTISFAFSTTLGEVQLHYLRSQIFGLGNVRCWVDDNEPASVYIQGYWDIIVNIAQSTTIKGLTPGAHVLNCEITEETADPGGKHEFRIISITSI